MILLLGGSGYVGSAFQEALLKRGIEYRSLGRAEADYTNTSILLTLLRDLKPDFLINAAGFTGKPNVDACEVQKAETLFGNSVLPGRIAEACAAAGVPWGHISSGCIYSGDGPRGAGDSGFKETDTPNFTFRTNHCSFYSGTKALGEEILEGCGNVYVWRLRIPFDNEDGPRNYLTKLMRYQRLLEARNSISQRLEYAAACLDTWQRRIPCGTYNVTNPGSVTTREVVAHIVRSGVCDKHFNFFESEEEFMKLAAKTPRSNCVLDTTKLESCGIHMTPVHEALDRALASWKKSA
jgi:dTDP-4-dehydrorhamnose reductase